MEENNETNTYRLKVTEQLRSALEEVKERYDGELPDSASESYSDLVEQMIDEIEYYVENSSEYIDENAEVRVLEGVVEDLKDTLHKYKEKTDNYGDSVDEATEYLENLDPEETFSLDEFKDRVSYIGDNIDRYSQYESEDVSLEKAKNQLSENRSDVLYVLLGLIALLYFAYRLVRREN